MKTSLANFALKVYCYMKHLKISDFQAYDIKMDK